jgi:hypothetical protein
MRRELLHNVLTPVRPELDSLWLSASSRCLFVCCPHSALVEQVQLGCGS